MAPRLLSRRGGGRVGSARQVVFGLLLAAVLLKVSLNLRQGGNDLKEDDELRIVKEHKAEDSIASWWRGGARGTSQESPEVPEDSESLKVPEPLKGSEKTPADMEREFKTRDKNLEDQDFDQVLQMHRDWGRDSGDPQAEVSTVGNRNGIVQKKGWKKVWSRQEARKPVVEETKKPVEEKKGKRKKKKGSKKKRSLIGLGGKNREYAKAGNKPSEESGDKPSEEPVEEGEKKSGEENEEKPVEESVAEIDWNKVLEKGNVENSNSKEEQTTKPEEDVSEDKSVVKPEEERDAKLQKKKQGKTSAKSHGVQVQGRKARPLEIPESELPEDWIAKSLEVPLTEAQSAEHLDIPKTKPSGKMKPLKASGVEPLDVLKDKGTEKSGEGPLKVLKDRVSAKSSEEPLEVLKELRGEEIAIDASEEGLSSQDLDLEGDDVSKEVADVSIEGDGLSGDGSRGDADVSKEKADATGEKADVSMEKVDVTAQEVDVSKDKTDVSEGNAEVSKGVDHVSDGNADVSTENAEVSKGNTDVISKGKDDVSDGNADDVSKGKDDVSKGKDDVSKGKDDVSLSKGNADVGKGAVKGKKRGRKKSKGKDSKRTLQKEIVNEKIETGFEEDGQSNKENQKNSTGRGSDPLEVMKMVTAVPEEEERFVLKKSPEEKRKEKEKKEAKIKQAFRALKNSGRQILAPKNLWSEPPQEGWSQCTSRESDWAGLSKKTKGYIYTDLSGGLTQQVFQVANGLTLARILEATYIVPRLQSSENSISKFETLFHLQNLRDILALDVRILTVNELPLTISREINDWKNVDALHLGTAEQYVENYSLELSTKQVLRFGNFSDALNPFLAVGLEKLRCRIKYQGLQLSGPVRELAEVMLKRLKKGGPFLAMHLGFEEKTSAGNKCIADEKIISNEVRACPPAPEDVAKWLQALGYGPRTQIYIASVSIRQGKQIMKSFFESFPISHTKAMLMTEEEWNGVKSNPLLLEALDFHLVVNADVSALTSDSLTQHSVKGHRAWMMFQKVLDFPHTSIGSWKGLSWKDYVQRAREETGRGGPVNRRDPDKSVVESMANPVPDCMCLAQAGSDSQTT